MKMIKALGIFIAGGISLEAMTLLVANASIYDRRDVVNAIADAQKRSRDGDYPIIYATDLSGIEGQLLKEEVRCGIRKNDNIDPTFPFIMYLDISANYRQSYRDTFRWGVAQYNNIFRLKGLRLCRAFGGCGGDWWLYLKQPDMSRWDHPASASLDGTDAERLQTAKDYACGLARAFLR